MVNHAIKCDSGTPNPMRRNGTGTQVEKIQSIEHSCGCAPEVCVSRPDLAELIASGKCVVMSWLLVTGSGAQRERTRECAAMRI